jgi:hypothetical protein
VSESWPVRASFQRLQDGTQIAPCLDVKGSLFAMETIKFIDERKVVRKPERQSSRRPVSFARVRGVFAFLFVATVFVYAFCNEKELQSFVFDRLAVLSQAINSHDSLRQSALNYERQVDQIAK